MPLTDAVGEGGSWINANLGALQERYEASCDDERHQKVADGEQPSESWPASGADTCVSRERCITLWLRVGILVSQRQRCFSHAMVSKILRTGAPSSAKSRMRAW